MDFVTKGNEYGYDQILSGTGHRYMELAVPQGKKVKRGDAVNAGAELSDGTATKTKTTVAVSGEVIYEGLAVKSTTVKADFIKKARDKGIIVKELGGRE